MSETSPSNFIRHIIDADLTSGKHTKIHTRFPPEPNGFLHIGHAKSICLNFGISNDYQGRCNLRFDDTNPSKEKDEFVSSIQQDVKWLGFDWQENLFYASNYFDQLVGFAKELIQHGDAYVCDLNAEKTRQYRGSLKEGGKNSPFRERSIEENLDLFERMVAGEFPDGKRVLRAKIDMASPNINLRDPTLYRIRHGIIHHQTGDSWCIYPMYDFTHPISDALEGITHSLCTLEFEDHRPLYDWVLDHISIDCHPQQIEFSRLNLQYTVVSKRKLTQLVEEQHVNGWDDPRMPTIAGLRRRGYTPSSIREFSQRIGITKVDNSVEMGMLEACIREDLDVNAARAMAVLHPLKVTITTYPDNQVDLLSIKNHPKNDDMGTRQVPMTRQIVIDKEDFREEAPRKFKRLITGGEVRLRGSYVIKCEEVIKNDQGEIIELKCSHDANTLGKNPEGRKVRGVIHWVSATEGLNAEIRLYDRLFNHISPDTDKSVDSFLEHVNPNSLERLSDCLVEPSLAALKLGENRQFEREGYFCLDKQTTESGKIIFNRTVTLRDSWAAMQKKNKS